MSRSGDQGMSIMAYLTISDPAIADLGLDATIAQALVDTASAAADSYCRRSFDVLAQPEARVFVANRGEVLIDDVPDTDGVTVEVQTVADGDWQTIDDPEWTPFNGWPKGRIVGLAMGRYPVRVTAAFGFAATVPAPVVMAVRLMVVRLGERTRQGYATRRETIGEYGITYATPEDLKGYTFEPAERMLLNPYVRTRFGTLEGD